MFQYCFLLCILEKIALLVISCKCSNYTHHRMYHSLLLTICFREDVTQLYLSFCEVARPENSEKEAWIIQKYPDSYKDEQVLGSVPKFAYPCEFEK